MSASEVPAKSVPDDVQQLEEEITATRERLGDAVEELVAKLDVKSQAKARVTQVKGDVLGRFARIRNQAAAGTVRAREQAVKTAGAARQRAVTAAGAAPEPARRAAATSATAAKRRPVQLAAGAVGLLIAGLVAFLLGRKR
ncbi:MAG TPA: DUF3618 domain-containing protein [Trebonia sp.]